MALVQALPELDDVYIPLARRSRAEGRWPQDVASAFGRSVALLLQQQVKDEIAYLARCKRAAILERWLTGTPMQQIEERFTINAFSSIASGHVRGVADATRFHLRSASTIATALLIENGPSQQDIDALLTQLEFGIPADMLNLLTLPVTLSRGEYLLLRTNGVRTIGELWSLSSEKLIGFLGTSFAEALERHRPADPYAAVS